jgi:hypothetical protein
MLPWFAAKRGAIASDNAARNLPMADSLLD